MVVIEERPGICESAGLILQDKEKRVLAVYRKINPEGWGLPSCHSVFERKWQRVREEPGDAVRKMAQDELGIRLIHIWRVLDQQIAMFEKPCRYGFRHHVCTVYGVKSYQGVPKVMKPEKHAKVEFVSADQLAALEKTDRTDSAWYRFLFHYEKVREVIWGSK